MPSPTFQTTSLLSRAAARLQTGFTLIELMVVLLIIGVFAMLYVRERRLWIWLGDAPEGTRVLMALSTPRRTLDADAEFDTLRSQLLGAPTAGDSTP